MERARARAVRRSGDSVDKAAVALLQVTIIDPVPSVGLPHEPAGISAAVNTCVLQPLSEYPRNAPPCVEEPGGVAQPVTA